MSQVQSEPQEQIFDEIDDILNTQSPAHYQSQIKALKDTIKDFESICKRLSKSNNELQQKLQYYQHQQELFEQKTLSEDSTSLIFNQDYSTLQFDVNDIQELFKQYRTDLVKYKNKINDSFNHKNAIIAKLKEENQNYKMLNQDMKDRIYELEQQNQQFQETNNQLLLQLQDLETNKRRHKLQTPKYKSSRLGVQGDNYQSNSNFDNERSTYFNDNIQDQLQKLIQKLIKELEYQKNIKKKMNQEIKRLQKDIVNLEKEIMGKNQKIYSLEINALKKMKSQPYLPQAKPLPQKGQKKGEVRATYDAKESLRERVESRIYASKRNFSLMQLTNGQIQLNCKEKLTLALKLIKLYEKKIKEQDYTFLILTSISVYDFNPNNPDRMSIKLSKTEDDESIQEQYEKSQVEIIWNLGFLLDTIFNKTNDLEEQFGTYPQQTYLNQFVIQILENREINNEDTVLQLQKVVKDALKARS